MAELHLEKRHTATLTTVLRQHLPRDARVYAFGSRATGRGLKPHSDLDLLVDSPIEMGALGMGNLREALAESSLPCSVDLLMRNEAAPEFVDRLRAEGLIDLTASIQDPKPGE